MADPLRIYVSPRVLFDGEGNRTVEADFGPSIPAQEKNDDFIWAAVFYLVDETPDIPTSFLTVEDGIQYFKDAAGIAVLAMVQEETGRDFYLDDSVLYRETYWENAAMSDQQNIAIAGKQDIITPGTNIEASPTDLTDAAGLSGLADAYNALADKFNTLLANLETQGIQAPSE